MPSSVAHIFEAAGAELAGVVPWGVSPRPSEAPAGAAIGIYVVALTDDPGSLEAPPPRAPVSESAVDELLSIRPELTLDGVRPEPQELAARLSAFWLPDEVVLYIGLAGPRKTRPVGGELSK